MGHNLDFRLLLELQVNSSLIAYGQTAEHLHGLMVLKHFYRSDVLGLDILGERAVFRAGKVVAFHIHLVYVSTLILDLSRGVNIQSWHPLHHVAYRAVLRPGELANGVRHGVAVLSYAPCAHTYLLKLEGLYKHRHTQRVGRIHAIERYSFVGIAHSGKFKCSATSSRHFEPEHSLVVRIGKAFYFAAPIEQSGGDSAERFSRGYIRHLADNYGRRGGSRLGREVLNGAYPEQS